MTPLLSPDVVSAIEDLELAARLVVEGLRAGPHRSPFHGYSSEFQQHRPYRAGDDLKYLDWTQRSVVHTPVPGNHEHVGDAGA